MPPEAPVERPVLFQIAVWLNAAWGLLSLVLCGVFAFLTATGGGIASIAAISGEDDAAPIALVLFLASCLLLVGIAVGAISIFLAWRAWGMKRFWIWALLVWACLHGLSSFGILALLTIVGSVQALERIPDERAATAA